MASKSSSAAEAAYNGAWQTVLNTKLPGWDVAPEDEATQKKVGRRPDVLVRSPEGCVVWVECKFAGGKPRADAVQSQASSVFADVDGKGLDVHHSLAVLYPESRQARSTVAGFLESSVLQFALYTPSEDGTSERFPASGWLSGDMHKIAELLRHQAGSFAKTPRLEQSFVQAVEDGAAMLGCGFPKVAELVGQENCEQTDQMVSAICLNAFIFQHVVAQHHPNKVSSPTQMKADGETSAEDVLCMWKKILVINYYPIFGIARSCVNEMSSNTSKASGFCKKLIKASNTIASKNPIAAQTLAGDMFGHLINDRKFLASFYTLPPSAALLAELCVNRVNVDWSDKDSVTGLRAADFACGTGALLTAAYRQLRQKMRRGGLNPRDLHQTMLEDVFVGADIMPAAVHITAAALSAAHPDKDYTKTETHTMRYGDYNKELGYNPKIKNKKGAIETNPKGVRVGSLELLVEDTVKTLLGGGDTSVTAKGENPDTEVTAPEESFDIVVMNPPYTKPTNHAIESRQDKSHPNFAAFGSDADLQKAMSKRTDNLFRQFQTKTGTSVRDGYAGMGTDFFDLAHAKVKPGGTSGFVLSAAMPTGKSWSKLRDLLAREYEDVLVVSLSSDKAGRSSFSASTAMNEILLIATKREKQPAEIGGSDTTGGTEPSDETDWAEQPWTWATLDALPATILESQTIAETIAETDLEEGKTKPMKIGETEYGHITKCSRHRTPAMIRSREVVETLLNLTNPAGAFLDVKRAGNEISLPLCKLGELGKCGPVHRTIWGGKQNPDGGGYSLYDYKGGKVHFPVLWNHDNTEETKLVVPIDKYGIRVSNTKAAKTKAAEVWETATRLHFNLDFRFTSQPLAACLTNEKALGGRAWPSFTLQPGGKPRDFEHMNWVYPVLLWANSTLGLMTFFIQGTRNQKGRSNLTISRLPKLLVLDPRQLTDQQLRLAKDIYHRFENKTFKPANMADQDPVRQKLDEALLSELVGHDQSVMEELETARNQWCNEPHLRSGNRHTANSEES